MGENDRFKVNIREFTDFRDRNTALNHNAHAKSVWESIDRPIRPLIYHLHRVGLRTRFSCCGYHYEGEEGDEPKSHTQFPFFFLEEPDPSDQRRVGAFFNLCRTATGLGWRVAHIAGAEWGFQAITTGHMDKEWSRHDKLPESIHHYESRLWAIRRLTDAVRKMPTMDEEFEIVDGNVTREEADGEWMVKPKAPQRMKVDSDPGVA